MRISDWSSDVCSSDLASEVVAMDDSVEVALRRKKDSSMRVAVQAVKDCRADACISAGNTGAWMAISRYILKTLDGINRPAIDTRSEEQTSELQSLTRLSYDVFCLKNKTYYTHQRIT